jgi:predicted DNA-binding transcriptional regulator AlpA
MGANLSTQGIQPNYARAKQTAAHFKISRSTLWNWAKNRDNFPKPFSAGPRVTLFDIGAIDLYLRSEGCAK